MNRRSFLKLGGVSLLSSFLLPRLGKGDKVQQTAPSYWIGGKYFVQDTVNTDDLPERIWARIDGSWHVYPVRELPSEYIDWSINRRLVRLEDMLVGIMPSCYDGPHSAAVATYSRFGRGDSEFKVNNAIKGMGFIPKQERIADVIQQLKDTQDASMTAKVQVLIDNYSDRDLWDMTCQGSLELYTTPSFETHSFTNQMRNPVSTVVFLDVPSYEFRAVAKLIHAKDPSVSEVERARAEYINLVHTYFHSGPTDNIACIYYVIEVFDNSPGTYKPGSRIVPELDKKAAVRDPRSQNHRTIAY